MTLKTYELPYGDTVKTVALPEDEVIAEVRTKSFTPIPKEAVKSKILEAIRNPIGIGPLDERVKPGDTVCFICNDLTRVANSFDFMPVFLDELNRLGVPDDHMKIVFSLGAHRKMTRDEMAEAVGEEVAARVPMFNSDCYADQDFEYFGQTTRGTPVLINKLLCDVDHVILTGTIVFHYFAGFGGGRKAILPGCAAMETIRMNHQWMMDDRVGLGITTGNPCYEDQVEGVERFAKVREGPRPLPLQRGAEREARVPPDVRRALGEGASRSLQVCPRGLRRSHPAGSRSRDRELRRVPKGHQRVSDAENDG